MDKKDKPKLPDYLADLYTDKDWQHLLLAVELGSVGGPSPHQIYVYDPAFQADLEILENLKPIVDQGQAADARAAELAKWISENHLEAAMEMIKRQHDADG